MQYIGAPYVHVLSSSQIKKIRIAIGKMKKNLSKEAKKKQNS